MNQLPQSQVRRYSILRHLIAHIDKSIFSSFKRSGQSIGIVWLIFLEVLATSIAGIHVM
jgi:hypothetical protein